MSRTVLVIEDEPAVAGMIKNALVADGCDVVVASDGESGLDRFAESRFDAVVVDVVLPRLQGFDLLPRLRNLPGGAEVPVVMLRGDVRGDGFAERAEGRHDIAAYLHKPVDLKRLTDVVRAETGHAGAAGGQLAAVLGDDAAAAEPPPPEPPPISTPMQGELNDVPFARLLGAIYSHRRTGALMLRKSSVKKLIYFREGLPTFVKSNLLHECLGRIMVAERLITQEECDHSLARKQTEPHKRQGELLVDMGCISPHNLAFGLELQMQAKLFDVFSWLEGRYQFNASVEYDGEAIPMSMGPAMLIYEGASRAMSTERIRRDLQFAQDWMLVPTRSESFRYQALQLDPRADRFLARIDGTRSVAALIASGELSPADATVILYALVCTSLVRVAAGWDGPFPVPSERPVIPVPDAKTAAIASDDEVTLARVFGGPRGLNIPRRPDDDSSQPTADLEERPPRPYRYGDHRSPGEIEQQISVSMVGAEAKAQPLSARSDPLSTMDDEEWAHEIDAALDKSWAVAIEPGADKPSADLDLTADLSAAGLHDDASELDDIEVVVEVPLFDEDDANEDALTEDLESMSTVADVPPALNGLSSLDDLEDEPLPDDFVLSAIPSVLDSDGSESSVEFRVPEIEEWMAAADPLPEALVTDERVPEVDAYGRVQGASDADLVEAEPLPASVVREASTHSAFDDVFDAKPVEPLPESVVFEAPVPEYDEDYAVAGVSAEVAVGAEARATAVVDTTILHAPALPASIESNGESTSADGHEDPTRVEDPPLADDDIDEDEVELRPGAADDEEAELPTPDEVLIALMAADTPVDDDREVALPPPEAVTDPPLVAADTRADDDDAWADDIEVVFEDEDVPAEVGELEHEIVAALDALTPLTPDPSVPPPLPVGRSPASPTSPSPTPALVHPHGVAGVAEPAGVKPSNGLVPPSPPTDVPEVKLRAEAPMPLPPTESSRPLHEDPVPEAVAPASDAADVAEDVWLDDEEIDASMFVPAPALPVPPKSADLEMSGPPILRPLVTTERSEEERRRTEQELANRLDRLATMTHYEVLELGPAATDDQIRDARARLESQFHPDRWTPDQLTARARRLAEQATLIVRRAADQLLSTTERVRYDRSIGVTVRPAQADPFEAEAAFRLGQEAVAREATHDAERQFRRAIEKAPQEGEYVAALAEALAARDAIDEATTLLQRASDLSPASRAVSLARARMHRRRSDKTGAVEWYGRVLKLDPDCGEAREFLAAQDKLFTRRTSLLSRLTKA